MTIGRIRVALSAFGGAPGFSNFYCTPGDEGLAMDGIKALYDGMVNRMPNGMKVTYPSTGDELAEATGVVTGSWTATPPAQTTGGDSSVYPGQSGACVIWETGAIVAGRRLRGRTFLVPLTSAAYDIDGTLSAGTLTIIQSAISACLTAAAGSLVVWHRPVGGSGGSEAVIVSGRVSDHVATLRSRGR